MTDTELLSENHGRRIAALESVLPKAVNDLIYADPHMWSDRPCGTCKTISNLIGAPFGCNRRQAERKLQTQERPMTYESCAEIGMSQAETARF